MKNIIICLSLMLPVVSWAQCPADINEIQRSNKTSALKSARINYKTDWTKPESVNCYYRILLLESKLAFTNDDNNTLEQTSKKLLELDPSSSWGIFFMRHAFISLGKPLHGELSIDRMPTGRIDDAFIKKLVKTIENKS